MCQILNPIQPVIQTTTMKTLTTILLLLLSIQCLQAQTDSMQKKVEPATVTLLSQGITLEREIYETADSAILMRIPLTRNKKDSLTVYTILSVPVDRIHTITLRKKSVGRAIRNGALIGFGVGAFIGLAASTDMKEGDMLYMPKEAMAISTGVIFAVPGVILGAAIGAFSRVVIPIKGRQDNYDRHRSRLVEFSVQQK